jgi:EmrB/QacA subfamily drug resistance transporter
VASAVVAPNVEPLAHRQVLVVFSGLVLVMLLAALDSTIVATALPTIVGELGGLAHLSWVITAYLLAQTVVTPLYGKLGDLYGRKIVLQVGIVLFLTGSALCGMSRTMLQLILFRAIQGFGGGGLMVTTQAVVGDIVPPRDRGRYQGMFGAVFGVASVAGPLLGGYFTTHLSWRWIFYVNLPLGVLALIVLRATLPPGTQRVARRLDYAGAALLAVALGTLVLAADLGGAVYAWRSPQVAGLGALALVAFVVFLRTEQRAQEPVLPLRLFANRSFAVAAALGLIVGFALFGSVTYLPLFLQVVNHATPTQSGLLMLPLMGGMLVTSIVSGQVISRTGRYKSFPVAGTAVMSLGLFLLSRMSAHTSTAGALGMMLLLGLGLGMVMQVLVIAVQNAVDYTDLGVATSGTTLFRLIGGSLGTALMGALFAARLAAELARHLPGDAAAHLQGASLGPDAIAALDPATRGAYAAAFTAAIGSVFLVATAIAVAGFALSWLLPERPLRASVAAAAGEVGAEMGEAFPMPAPDDAMATLARSLAALADRDVRHKHVEAIVAQAGVDLSVPAAAVLMGLEREPHVDPVIRGHTLGVTAARIAEALAELRTRGLIEGTAMTDAGCAVAARLAEARRRRLAELFADWPAEKHEELATLLRRMVMDLVPEVARTPPRSAL